MHEEVNKDVNNLPAVTHYAAACCQEVKLAMS